MNYQHSNHDETTIDHTSSPLPGSILETVPLRCLTLRADYAYGDYPRGHRWFIPQSDIHREIRRMSRSDTEFMWRVRRCEVNRYDVEKIILGASHGVIRLHMV